MSRTKSQKKRASRAVTESTFDREIRMALLSAVESATPAQRLTLLTLREHPKLLGAFESMLDELREALR